MCSANFDSGHKPAFTWNTSGVFNDVSLIWKSSSNVTKNRYCFSDTQAKGSISAAQYKLSCNTVVAMQDKAAQHWWYSAILAANATSDTDRFAKMVYQLMTADDCRWWRYLYSEWQTIHSILSPILSLLALLLLSANCPYQCTASKILFHCHSTQTIKESLQKFLAHIGLKQGP